MQPTTPDFSDETEATEETVTEQTDGNIDLEVEDDANLDVDVPEDTDEVEDTSETTAEAKPAKAAGTPRKPAPEGYVKPVQFAKVLSEHLGKTVPPQVVYSYIKNNSGDSARNPFPVHNVDGYPWYIKAQEGLDWWDAKNGRVAAAKTAKATKEAAKATAGAAPAATEPAGEVTEAE